MHMINCVHRSNYRKGILNGNNITKLLAVMSLYKQDILIFGSAPCFFKIMLNLLTVHLKGRLNNIFAMIKSQTFESAYKL